MSKRKRTDQAMTAIRPAVLPLLREVSREQNGVRMIDVVSALVRWLHAQSSEVRHAVLRAGSGLSVHDEQIAKRKLTFDVLSEEVPERASSSSGSPQSGKRARPAA